MSLDLLTEQKLQYNIVFDLTKNKKQQIFFEEVMQTVAGKSDLRYFFYGGAVRGGKTSVCITILILLCKKFKGSRWHVIRDSFTTLEETTIPSFEKFCPESKTVKWNRNKSNYHLHFLETGSKIYLTSESIYQDPDLFWMDGLETNGIFLEQLEGLSFKMFEKARERSGSWLIDPMPPALVLGSTNPTQGWFKKEIYDKWRRNELIPPFYFLEALPSDNPFVTQDQWQAWSTLDEVSYAARIKGDWNSFATDRPFAYCFNEQKHCIDNIEYNENLELMLSFDFNVDPITCIAAQHDNETLNFLKAFKLSNSNIYELCDAINVEYGHLNPLYLITGDATGRSRSALTKGNINYYMVIKEALNVSDGQLKLPSVNPAVSDTRVLMNSLFQNYDVKISRNGCADLIYDLKYVEVDDKGDLLKDRSSDKRNADQIDCARYLMNTFFRWFIKVGRSQDELLNE